MTTKTHSRFWDFNPRIFAEGFRQLRTVGILALVVLCLAAVLLPVGLAIDTYSYLEEGEKVSQSLVSLMNMHPLIVLPMYTMALIMPLMVFGFLNKRRSSDFYHAIPVNRSALFISLFAAIMAWIVLVVVASTALSVITTLCFPALFQLNLSSILPFVCSCIAGALLVTGCVSMAMCITGTIFNNLLVAALIFFGPRLLMMYVAILLEDSVNILPETLNTPLLDFSYNIPMGIPYTFLFGDSITEVLHNWSGILYTTLIGLLWFLVSLVLFRIRGSESAERPASTPLLQHAYRLIVTFIVTLIPVWGIFSCIQNPDQWNATGIFVIFVLYLLAAIAFCVYELITTKKPKELLRVSKTFPLVLVADVILIVGLLISVHATLSFRPAASDITSVSFSERYSNIDEDYFAARASKVVIKDKAVIELAAKRLDEAAEENSPYGKIEGADKYWSEVPVSDFLVTFRTRGSAKQRVLAFTEEEAQVILNAMANNTEYQAIYQLPELGHKTSVNFWELTQEQSNEVYRVMYEEVKALPYEKRIELLSGYYPENQAFSGIWVSVETAIGAQDYTFDIALSAEHCPKAAKLYLQYEYENSAADRKQLIAGTKNFAAYVQEYGYATWHADVVTTNGENRNIWIEPTEDEEVDALLKKIAENIEDRAPTLNEPLYYLSFEYEERKEDTKNSGKYFTEYHHFYSCLVLNEEGRAALDALAEIEGVETDEWYYAE